MKKVLLSVLVALVVPYLIFVFVIKLNQSDLEKVMKEQSQVSFSVKKPKVLDTPTPQKPKEQRRRTRDSSLPSVQPGVLNSSLSGSGLSFGVPGFNEDQFAEFQDGGLLDSTINQTMDDSSVDTPPKVRKRAPLVYPELARRQGVSGFVTMNVLINDQGRVEDVEVVDSKPKDMFELQADSTIRQWIFEPATYNGQKVSVWATQKIVFKLN